MSYFLDYCFYENAIFGGWLPWLAKQIVNTWYKDQLPVLESIKENPALYEKKLIEIADGHFLFKILGGCIICSNVWQSIVTFNIIFWICFIRFDLSPWFVFLMLPYIFISSFAVRKIIKNEN